METFPIQMETNVDQIMLCDREEKDKQTMTDWERTMRENE